MARDKNTKQRRTLPSVMAVVSLCVTVLMALLLGVAPAVAEEEMIEGVPAAPTAPVAQVAPPAADPLTEEAAPVSEQAPAADEAPAAQVPADAGLAAEADGEVEVEAAPSVQYFVHRQTYGWEKPWSKHDGQSSGTTGQYKRLEGIRIRLCGVSGGIQYRTHVQTYGWQGWRKNGAMSGTEGKAKRLEAIQIKLTGAAAKTYDVWYRVHAQTFGWMGWTRNGGSAGTAGYAKRLESIQIRLVRKGGKAPGSTKNAFVDMSRTLANKGWRLDLPEYWRGRVKVSTGTPYANKPGCFSVRMTQIGKMGHVQPAPLLTVEEGVSRSYDQMASSYSVVLKTGQRAKTYWSAFGIALKCWLKNGKTLMLYTPYSGSLWGGTIDGVPGLTLAKHRRFVGITADLQSLGTITSYYDLYDSQGRGNGMEAEPAMRCLETLASRLSIF